jgi:hypothetical protein
MTQDPILYLCLVKKDGEPHPDKALDLRTFGLFDWTTDPPIHPVTVNSVNSLTRYKCSSVRDLKRHPCPPTSSLAKFITKDFDRCVSGMWTMAHPRTSAGSVGVLWGQCPEHTYSSETH